MKRRLGQHFLLDPSILGRIIQAASLVPSDTVVEIGPGLGRLTTMLASRVRRVIAIEIDVTLHERLLTEFQGYGNIELIHGDALDYPYESLGDFRVVANIPYYITTPLIFRLLRARECLKSMTITIQREVAERIVARPGGKEYGVLTLMVQYYADAAVKFVIPRGAFRPVPKVDSAVLHLEIRREPPVMVHDEDFFIRLIKTAFSQRRKTLANTLKPLAQDIKNLLRNAGIEPSRRPETLSMDDFARLADLLSGER